MSERRDWQRWLTEEALSLEFFSGGRSCVVMLSPDGAVSVRSHGGPLRHMGSLMNTRCETVRVWQMEPSSLRERLLRALAAEGFPFPGEQHFLVPDEHPSSLLVKHANGERVSVSMPHRFFEVHRALAPFDSELDQLCYKTQITASTGSIPNPELSWWDIPGSDR